MSSCRVGGRSYYKYSGAMTEIAHNELDDDFSGLVRGAALGSCTIIFMT
jgi:hypothetical protein